MLMGTDTVQPSDTRYICRVSFATANAESSPQARDGPRSEAVRGSVSRVMAGTPGAPGASTLRWVRVAHGGAPPAARGLVDHADGLHGELGRVDDQLGRPSGRMQLRRSEVGAAQGPDRTVPPHLCVRSPVDRPGK